MQYRIISISSPSNNTPPTDAVCPISLQNIYKYSVLVRADGQSEYISAVNLFFAWDNKEATVSGSTSWLNLGSLHSLLNIFGDWNRILNWYNPLVGQMETRKFQVLIKQENRFISYDWFKVINNSQDATIKIGFKSAGASIPAYRMDIYFDRTRKHIIRLSPADLNLEILTNKTAFLFFNGKSLEGKSGTDNLISGNCIETSRDGVRFEGNYTGQEFSGFCSIEVDESNRLSGQYNRRNGFFGKCTFEFQNGDVLEGEYNRVSGFHGKCKLTFKGSGDVLEGKYSPVSGFLGKCTYTFNRSGIVLEGNYSGNPCADPPGIGANSASFPPLPFYGNCTLRKIGSNEVVEGQYPDILKTQFKDPQIEASTERKRKIEQEYQDLEAKQMRFEGGLPAS